MSQKIHKSFQQQAIESALGIFRAARDRLDLAGNDPDSRAVVIRHHGTLLIEAPTGAGKTLMAGGILEQFSAEENVVWFWFAPFKGVTGQTAGFLRGQCPGLRLREMQDDRKAEGTKPGDVFVTTWQTVATRATDKRNVRRDSEQNISVDVLVARLRDLGLRIGVVVDEAHHSFHGDTQAAKFFKEVLAPEYTVLITATPDDKDLADFEKRLGGPVVNRTSIAREDVVAAGLIKSGVRCAAYLVEPGNEKMVDLERVALEDAVTTHRAIKAKLKASGFDLVPLLLVQVDSKPKSVEKAKERLLELGFTKDQIAVHTADEPDADLLILAEDERREALVFKMAVALGFDAPRAFTLYSSRAARDEDFGVQLVGRILRTHRLLQAAASKKKLPDDLAHGYVFLSDPASQTGLDLAGQRINRLRTNYASVSPNAVVVNIGGRMGVQEPGAGGTLSLFSFTSDGRIEPYGSRGQTEQPGGEKSDSGDHSTDPQPPPPIIPSPFGKGGAELNLGAIFSSGPETLSMSGGSPAKVPATVAQSFRYHLRDDVPRLFRTQRLPEDSTATEEDCARRFRITLPALFEATNRRLSLQKKTLEVFTGQLLFENLAADMKASEIERRALVALQRSEAFDPRELRRALLDQTRAVMKEHNLKDCDNPEAVRRTLDTILVTHPELLHEAQRQALAEFAVVENADPLPQTLESETALETSARNVYHIIPGGLNGWETDLVRRLDTDNSGTILWWHRNLPHKPWAVSVLLPNGRQFFPDFMVGVRHRPTPDNVLLTDPKYAFANDGEAPKASVRHPDYGRVLILHFENSRDWRVVQPGAENGRPKLGEPFRFADLAGW
jgi:hypothetical protein